MEGLLGEICPPVTFLSVYFCLRYEEEVSLRATAENEFVALKKVSNMGSGSRDTRNLRMTDRLFLERPRGCQLQCGVQDLAKSGWGVPRGQVRKGTSKALTKGNNFGLSTSTLPWGRQMAGLTSGCPALLQRLWPVAWVPRRLGSFSLCRGTQSCLALWDVCPKGGAETQGRGENGAEPDVGRWSLGGVLGDREGSRWLSRCQSGQASWKGEGKMRNGRVSHLS